MIKRWFGRTREPGRVVIEPDEAEITVPRSSSILQAALDRGIDFPHNCKVGTCVQCRCQLLDGEIKRIRDFSYVLTAAEIRAGYILACQSRVRPGQRVRLRLDTDAAAPQHPRVTTTGRITAQRLLTRDIVEVAVHTRQELAYSAGQYASLSRPGLDRPRDYSFATAPPATPGRDHRFFIRKVAGGLFTEWLFAAARLGELLEVAGPSGNFWLREHRAPLLLIAGGSGLAPVLALLEDAAARQVPRDAVLLFGARRQCDLYCLDRIDTVAGEWRGDFRFHPVLSEEPSDSGWRGHTGLVTDYITTRVVPRLARHHAYLCGPPAMIDTAIATLTDAGIANRDIHYDKFLDARDMM